MNADTWHAGGGGRTQQLWLWDLDAPPAEPADLQRVLSANEAERAGRFRFEPDRRRFMVARGLVRHQLGDMVGCAPGDLEFGYGRQGKPYLKGSEAAGVRFNVSHSGRFLVLITSVGGEVGIDVEEVVPIKDSASIVAGSFTERERRHFLLDHAQEDPIGLYRAWTAKEALLKAVGTGLSTDPRAVEVLRRPAGSVAFRGVGRGSCGLAFERWHAAAFTARIEGTARRAVGAVVAEGRPPTPSLHCDPGTRLCWRA